MTPGHDICFLELDEYLKQIKVRIPYHVIRGREAGPTLYVQACQHGTELHGWEAVRQLLESVIPDRLRGTLIAVPIANPLAFQGRRSGYPTDEHNLNRTWPGDAHSPSLAHRLSALLWDKLVANADTVVDLHSWGEHSLPLAWTWSGGEAWVRAFGTPYLCSHRVEPNGMLLNACAVAGKPCCLLEMLGQDSIHPAAATVGRRGVMNLMRFLGMIEGPMEFPEQRFLFDCDPVEHLLKASVEGLWVPAAPQSTLVNKGQVVGRVFDWATLAVIEEIVSPVDGFLFLDRPWGGNPNRSLVEPGTEVAMMRDVPRVLTPADGPQPGSWKTQTNQTKKQR